MPTPYLKDLAKKYNKPIKDLEGYWDEAKKAADESYDEKDDKYWGTVTEIFKNKVNKHMGMKESKIKSFKDYVKDKI